MKNVTFKPKVNNNKRFQNDDHNVYQRLSASQSPKKSVAKTKSK